MLFQHTLKKVLSGEKSRTSRLKKADEVLRDGVVYTAASRRKWYVGQIIAVQPARGQRAVACIRVLAITEGDVRASTQADANAEGFTDVDKWIEMWCKINHPAGYKELQTDVASMMWYGAPVGWAGTYLNDMSADRYRAFSLTFELVGAAANVAAQKLGG